MGEIMRRACPDSASTSVVVVTAVTTSDRDGNLESLEVPAPTPDCRRSSCSEDSPFGETSWALSSLAACVVFDRSGGRAVMPAPHERTRGRTPSVLCRTRDGGGDVRCISRAHYIFSGSAPPSMSLEWTVFRHMPAYGEKPIRMLQTDGMKVLRRALGQSMCTHQRGLLATKQQALAVVHCACTLRQALLWPSRLSHLAEAGSRA